MASVVASVTAREIVGATLIYEPRVEYALRHARELGLYLVLALGAVVVGEIMTTEPDAVRPGLTLDELRDEFRRTRHHGFPVVEEDDRLVGVVTSSDLASAPADARRVSDIATPRPLTVTPGDPVFRALRRMAAIDVGRLPVVDPQDHSRLVGLVRRADLVRDDAGAEVGRLLADAAALEASSALG